jgi:hypothetical protein
VRVQQTPRHRSHLIEAIEGSVCRGCTDRTRRRPQIADRRPLTLFAEPAAECCRCCGGRLILDRHFALNYTVAPVGDVAKW